MEIVRTPRLICHKRSQTGYHILGLTLSQREPPNRPITPSPHDPITPPSRRRFLPTADRLLPPPRRLTAASPPELTILRQQYEKAVTERVTAPYDAGLSELNARYGGALENSIAEAKKVGRLDDVLALQAEEKRLTAGLTAPEVDETEAPEVLKKLRTILRDQLGRLNETRLQNLDTILPPYQAKLQSLEVTLTQADRIDEAKTVKDYRLALSAGTAAGAPTVATVSTTPPPAPPVAEVRGGVLKGLGQFMFGSLPVDLSNAEGVTDFVEIKVSHMGWIARRANGEVRFQIQANGDKNKGILNKKKAIRVCATEGKPFFAIYEDGTAEVVGTKYYGTGAFPSDAADIPSDAADIADVDAATGLYVVLHRDGTCTFAGKRLEEMVKGLNLKAPGILPEVAAVTCARYQVAFLMTDGSVKMTSDFRTNSPGWGNVPPFLNSKMMAISTGAGGADLVGVTNRGGGAAPEVSPLNKGLKDLVDVKVGGGAAIVKDTFGRWQIAKPGDEEMGKLLVTALATPGLIDVDLHNHDNSGDGKDVSRAVLWIEPAP